MKNNILLILAVAVISVGIIVATVLITTYDSDGESSSQSEYSSSATTSYTPAEVEPEVTTTSAPDTTSPDEIIIPSDDMPYDEDMAHSITSTARSLLGIDFADGGASPESGFDNSGFIYYVLRENGYITCPRGVGAQSEMGAALSYEQLCPGDLAFFYDEELKAVQFGGIYCGDGIMIACLMPGTKVKEVDISTNYYRQHFYRGVSLT